MNKHFFTLMTFIAIVGMATTATAQLATTDVLKTRTKSNQSNEIVGNPASGGFPGFSAAISSTVTGCDIVCTYDLKTAKGIESNAKPFGKTTEVLTWAVSSSDNTITETSGGASSSKLKATASSKASFSDVHFSVSCDRKPVSVSVDNGVCSLPQDCPDGVYNMRIEWTWISSNNGVTDSHVIVTWVKKDGVVSDMAINEKGLPGTKTSKGKSNQ